MPTLTVGISYEVLFGKISSEVRKTPHFSAGLSCRDDCLEFELFGGLGGVEGLPI